MPATMKITSICLAVMLLFLGQLFLLPGTANAISVDVGNFSFETPATGNAMGLYGALNNTQVWTGDATGLHGFGFADLAADDGMQNVSLRQGAVLTQELNGGTIDGFTKASIPLPAYDTGDTISLTVAYALRDNAAIEWADASFFALYDSTTFDLFDPVGTSLATTGFLSEPSTRGDWIDLTLDYTVTGNEEGFLGIYIRGEHLGTITGASAANHQAFFDTVRLDAPAISVLDGDVNLDNRVDLIDFGIVRDNFLNIVNSRGEGDLNGDDIVNFADFQEVVDNYPFPPPAGGFASLLAGTNVPEPSSLVILLAMLGCSALRRRRF